MPFHQVAQEKQRMENTWHRNKTKITCIYFFKSSCEPTALIHVEQEMQFWYVTPYNNMMQLPYLTCLHDSRQLFPLQFMGWRQHSVLILSFLTVSIPLKTAFSFLKLIHSSFCSFSILMQSCHCLVFPRPAPLPFHTYLHFTL